MILEFITIVLVSLFVFSFFWWVMFKLMVHFYIKKPLKDIYKKIGKQDKIFIIDGKERSLKKDLRDLALLNKIKETSRGKGVVGTREERNVA